MVDTGAGSAVSLTTAFDARFGLSGKLPKGPVAPLSGGVGGMTQGRLLRLKAFEVGEHRLESPVSTLTLSQGGALGVGAKYDCILGAEILRRFLVTFDYKSKRMWLEPSPALTEPFEVDHAGILLKSEGNDFLDFVVYEVVPESPAAEAGLRKDDEILELDDVDLASMTLDILRKRFRRGGKPWRIKVRRGGETLEVTVRPRPLA
jgi:membrane-associated protease RseP (regulator of RpoE activity)